MKLFSLFAICLTAAQVARPAAPAMSTLEQSFHAPPLAERPWVYYWWLRGNVTRESIHRDLEQMKEKGIGGFLLCDSRGYADYHLAPPPAKMEFLSPEWRQLVKFTMTEANRLGLQMSMNISTSGGSLKGPWDNGANAPKKLIWSAATAPGPGHFEAHLAKPDDQPYFWDVALLAVRLASPVGTAQSGDALSQNWREIKLDRKAPWATAEQVVDLTARLQAGHLAWDVPPGNWTILRFATVTIKGLEQDVDILDSKAVDTHFGRMGKAFLEIAGPLAGKTLTHFYNVSWEGSSPTWTPGFERDFTKRRGYDLLPYLPALTGMTVKDEATSRRFIEDFGKTIGDSFLDNCYGRLGDAAHKAGLKWHSESGGPWDRARPMFQFSDELSFWGANDMPQGEFWHKQPIKGPGGVLTMQSNLRHTAMAAHIYGRRLVASESFTDMNPHWQEYPAVLKPDIDKAFIDGANHVVWHTFDGSPAEFGIPGIVYFAGTHLNTNTTWWNDAGGFLAYLGRAQIMLRQGTFVADAVVYQSYRNMLVWGRGEKWREDASLQLPSGYTYDLIDTASLLGRISVKNGNLVLPDGMSYRMLVLDLDENVMPAAALAKITQLAKEGANIVLGSRRPERQPGLESAKERDAQIGKLAAALWAGSGTKSFGQGRVSSGVPLSTVLNERRIQPDFAGPFEYLHRQDGQSDIYFLRGSGKAECTFRVKGRIPELWDAVTGSVRDVPQWHATDDGRTVAALDLPEDGSVFVVFRRPTAQRRGSALELSWRAAPVSLDGPWTVTFARNLGAPPSASFDQLKPWDENPQPGIRYFSGTATYSKSFALDAAQSRSPLRLALGEVKDIARVRLNGKVLAIVWTAPWVVDLTGVAKAGTNELEIDVTNTWANRLIGDAALPESQWVTKTIVRRPADWLGHQGRQPYLRGYLATDPLMRSGLVGPVRIEFGEKP